MAASVRERARLWKYRPVTSAPVFLHEPRSLGEQLLELVPFPEHRQQPVAQLEGGAILFDGAQVMVFRFQQLTDVPVGLGHQCVQLGIVVGTLQELCAVENGFPVPSFP